MKAIGLQNKKVKLSSYNPVWVRLYKKEEKILLPLVKMYGLEIQHIGSTSIPGAKAKPIIDIAIGVKNLKDAGKFIKPLEILGYEYKHDAGISGRHFFARIKGEETTHHLHIVKINGKLWNNQIIFRDYLKKHKRVVKEYNDLKEMLAHKYENDRKQYTAKKNSFIQGIIKKSK